MAPQPLDPIDFTCRHSVESLLMRSSSMCSNTGRITRAGDSNPDSYQEPTGTLLEQSLGDLDQHCMNPSDYEELRKLPGNDCCIDCDSPDPEWASISLGIFLCLQCSGQHRALGTHVSKVRSVRLDTWTEEQVELMRCGGNSQCKKFLEEHGYGIELEISDRYDNAAGLLYQSVLKARREGAPEPTELPAYVPPPKVVRRSSTNSVAGNVSIGNPSMNRNNMQGFGSDGTNSSDANNGGGGGLSASWSRLTSQWSNGAANISAAATTATFTSSPPPNKADKVNDHAKGWNEVVKKSPIYDKAVGMFHQLTKNVVDPHLSESTTTTTTASSKQTPT
eukprot:Nitzschia sp. Nitz4//scaffold12_size214221//35243//36390//NITZ4_001484-RA/size214221-augustus-gene-0.23-mRNA-1//-1//CDS//3329534972//7516//frame0